MAPIVRHTECEDQSQESNEILTAKDVNQTKDNEFKVKIVWRNVVLMGALHVGALIGAYLMVTEAKYQTVIAWFLLYICSGRFFKLLR